MGNLKKYKKSIFILICIISLFTLLFSFNNQKHKQNKIGLIDKNHIVSFKIHNIKAEEKEIKNKSDRDNIIKLIDSVHITKSGVEPVDGVGFGVIITYSNGVKFSASFTGSVMCYTLGSSMIWCKVDKNIMEDLRSYYNNN